MSPRTTSSVFIRTAAQVGLCVLDVSTNTAVQVSKRLDYSFHGHFMVISW